MRFIRHVLAALAVVLFSASGLLVDARNPAVAQTIPVQGEQPGSQIYLLRGFANVFSLGFDVLAGKIERETGMDAHVRNHLSWGSVAEDIARRQGEDGRNRPVVLIGHSLGAGAAVAASRHLGRRDVQVDLLVMVGLISKETVPSNVVRALNIQPSRSDGLVAGAPGFQGQIVDISLTDDLDVAATNHFTMESNAQFHSLIISEVKGAIRRAGRRS